MKEKGEKGEFADVFTLRDAKVLEVGDPEIRSSVFRFWDSQEKIHLFCYRTKNNKPVILIRSSWEIPRLIDNGLTNCTVGDSTLTLIRKAIEDWKNGLRGAETYEELVASICKEC
ncbi:hypothetical protein COB55_04250 [Candidatus Wolfebacteria bacterium]|nr:MAG: hypothetical protein COB55_04250 [Candidatus Wolfebacteria bacterium]